MINKRTKGSRFYDFYASYTDSFALDVIRNLAPYPDSIVLDPWNGSGTTTFAAGCLGLRAVGLDINPALILVAKARLASHSEHRKLYQISEQLRTADLGTSKQSISDDSLTQWFGKNTAARIRALQNQIGIAIPPRSILSKYVESLPVDKCLRFISLFKLIRLLTKKFESSNPTWVKLAKSPQAKLSFTPVELIDAYRNVVDNMKPPTCNISADVRSSISIICADARDIQSHVKEPVHCIITSPPYCTRIDYPIKTRRELAVLGISDDFNFRLLRKESIGTPLMVSNDLAISETWGPTCGQFLESVRTHESKASATYYFNIHLQYFDSLSTVLGRSFQLLANGGQCAIVVQGSYYKGILNNLPQIVIEMVSAYGDVDIFDMVEFQSSSRYRHNPHARKRHSSVATTEHILFMEKQR